MFQPAKYTFKENRGFKPCKKHVKSKSMNFTTVPNVLLLEADELPSPVIKVEHLDSNNDS